MGAAHRSIANVPQALGADSTTMHFAALTPRQVRAVMALLEGKTRTAAATEAGVDRRTLFTWLKLPAVRAALDADQAELAATRMERLRRSVTMALDHFIEILEREPPEGANVWTRLAFLEGQAAAARVLLSRMRPMALADLFGARAAGQATEDEWHRRYIDPPSLPAGPERLPAAS